MPEVNLEIRHIPLEGGSNLRDVGGYPAKDGRMVRWGTIYRSGAMSRLTEADWRWMAGRNIAAVCDLRSREEREIAPTVWRGGEQTRHIGPAYEGSILFNELATREAGVGEMSERVYPLFAEVMAPLYREFFGALVAGHAPVIIHCSAGQDRTGLAIGLLLSLLGVPEETILEDYHLSTRLRRVENEVSAEKMAELADSNVVARFYMDLVQRRGEAALKPRALYNQGGGPLLIDAFTAIRGRWGSLEAYMDDKVGVGPADVERLRTHCLEDFDAGRAR